MHYGKTGLQEANLVIENTISFYAGPLHRGKNTTLDTRQAEEVLIPADPGAATCSVHCTIRGVEC